MEPSSAGLDAASGGVGRVESCWVDSDRAKRKQPARAKNLWIFRSWLPPFVLDFFLANAASLPATKPYLHIRIAPITPSYVLTMRLQDSCRSQSPRDAADAAARTPHQIELPSHIECTLLGNSSLTSQSHVAVASVMFVAVSFAMMRVFLQEYSLVHEIDCKSSSRNA